MKTITLGFLLREPRAIKRLTRAGESITVTIDGNPLCIIRPADQKESRGGKAEMKKQWDRPGISMPTALHHSAQNPVIRKGTAAEQRTVVAHSGSYGI